jgi:hypothetical protein
MRRNIVPGLVLQSVALTLLLLYTTSTSARAFLDAVGVAKHHYGYAFSALSTALFGGLIPYLIVLFTGRVDPRLRLSVLAFYVLFWVWKGVEVDAFYRLQAYLFGDAASVRVIANKTLVDQFVYNPLWAAPTQVWFFLWKDTGFSLAETKGEFVKEPFLRRVVIVLVSSWVVWIPTVAIVYALPSALQIPLFNLVVCFWSLLLTSLSQRNTQPSR